MARFPPILSDSVTGQAYKVINPINLPLPLLPPKEEVSNTTVDELNISLPEVEGDNYYWDIRNPAGEGTVGIFSNIPISLFNEQDQEEEEEEVSGSLSIGHYGSFTALSVVEEIEPGLLCPSYCFKRLPKHFTRLFSSLSSTYLVPLISQIEDEIISFLFNDSVKETSLYLSSSFHRLILHGICKYYSLDSFSYYCSVVEGRLTIIRKNSDLFDGSYPAIRLSHFISSN